MTIRDLIKYDLHIDVEYNWIDFKFTNYFSQYQLHKHSGKILIKSFGVYKSYVLLKQGGFYNPKERLEKILNPPTNKPNAQIIL